MILPSLIMCSLALLTMKGVKTEATDNMIKATEIVPIEPTTSTGTHPGSNNCTNISKLNIPSDTIIVLDTSESFGKHSFERAREFLRELFRKTSVLREEHTRIAVVTFAAETTILLDYISLSGGKQIPECELFRENGTWSQMIQYDLQNGENLYDALYRSLQMLSQGRLRRTGQVQRVWIISDMKRMLDAQKQGPALAKLKQVAEVYGIGYGQELGVNQTLRFMGYVSSPAQCYYSSLEEWEGKSVTFEKPLEKTKRELWLSHVNQSACNNCTGICQCQEFSPDQQSCVYLATVGETPHIDVILAMIVSTSTVGAIFVILVAVSIVVCMMEIRAYQKKQRPTSPMPDDISSNSDTQPVEYENSQTIAMAALSTLPGDEPPLWPEHTGEIYENQIVPEIIHAHAQMTQRNALASLDGVV